MKKLYNNRFLFILSLSLIVLIVLGVGAFYLFDDSDATFVKSGYVLNPLSSKVEKYFFNEDVSYKENLSSMVEFKDVDNNEVSVLRDSFLHYMDNSLSFLKNGAILDLDSIKGDGVVTFYNISNESIIERTKDGYVIRNVGSDIKLKNFMGRINDNKYIVVGDLSAKIPGNSTNIKGEYFEIVYVEEGVVNIENKDVKYQVAADGTLIYVGSLVIDLGDKKITYNDEDVMSITAITIDGDENIEIIPKAPEEDENEQGEGGDGTGTGTGTGTGDGTGSGTGTGDGNGSGSGDGTGTGSGDGTGSGEGGDGTGGSGSDGNDSGDTIKDLVVSLKDATIGSTNVNVTFDIYNKTEEDKFMLKVTNLATNTTVDMVAEVLEDVEIQVNLLTPNTKYLFTVVNEKDNGKYFQKIFETNDFGIKLEKAYATDSELAYKISISEGTDITNAKLSLYKYNEETKKNEIVTTSYFDSQSEEMKYVEKVTYLSRLEGNIEGVHEIVYDGLDSNTIYTAVLDEFSVASSNFKDIYNITLTSMTLKKTPTFSDMKADSDVGAGSFKLSLGNIEDVDSAIIDYTYLIYEEDNDEEPVINPITKSNASPIEVKIGDGDNELKNDTNYYYKVIIQYFDNEKYIEFITTDRIDFMMGDDPYITVVPDEAKISYDKIAATIYLTDNSCLISMPGRGKCTGISTTVVEVNKINSITGDRTPIFTKLVDFKVTDNEIKYDLFIEGLQAGTSYSIDVRADINNTDEVENTDILHTDESKRTITTKSLSSFVNEWNDKGSSANHVINVQSKFIAQPGSGTLSPEDSAAAIKKVVIKLFEGENVENLQNNTDYIAIKNLYNNDTFNIKEQFYDKGYVITSDGTFGLTIDELKEISTDGKLSEYYTVYIEAYYDEYETSPVILDNKHLAYAISPILLMDNIEDPIVELKEVTNNQSGKLFDKLNNSGTIVGYTVTAAFDRTGLLANNWEPKNINIYVYDSNKNKVKFFVKNAEGNLELVDKLNDVLDESNYYENIVYMDYGTEYSVNDSRTTMRRGNGYYIGYDLDVASMIEGDDTVTVYPASKDEESPSDFGVYKFVDTIKETPNVKMYIASSTENSIKYRYEIKDPDSSLYRASVDDKHSFYYTIGDEGEEKSLELVNVDTNVYAGDLVIEGLSNGSKYSLYYKKNISKTGQFENDVVNYLEGEDKGARIFDGYYDVSKDEYKFSYKVINNPLSDNKVVIKILASDSMLNRILSYRVHFEDEYKNVLDKEIWKLTDCKDNDGELARCFSVDYALLKEAGMKSDKNKENTIRVTIDAVYDNGLVGYDFVVGSKKNDDDETKYDYPYMILQNNNTSKDLGLYVSYSSAGNLTNWNADVDFPKGYYTYSLSGSLLNYRSALDNSNRANISVSLSSLGYTSRYGELNPKMVSIASMKCDDNTFSFSSITPKIGVTEYTTLINGAVMDFVLSGVDLNDFKNEGTEEEPKYYLYVDVWNNIEYAENYKEYDYARVRPTLKVPINPSDPYENIRAVIDGLRSGTQYYFNVYALMYKGGSQPELTQLFDVKYENEYIAESYGLKALNYQGVFQSIEVSYTVNDKVAYGNRDLNTKINLRAYNNAYPYNFEIMYAFCHSSDLNCGIDDNSSNIFKKGIDVKDLSSSVVDKVDISPYDLEFGKQNGYYMYVYAIAKDYQNNYKFEGSEEDIPTQKILLNIFDVTVTLKALTEPTFVVERDAGYENGNYFIDFNVIVKDYDRTLLNGNYFVKLIDENGNIVGNLQEIDKDGNYIDIADYDKHPFDALVVNKHLRINGLKEDTKYTIVVYNDAYLNNYSLTIPKEERTYEVAKSHTVYSANKYGVAFGNDLLFSATARSIVVTFLGGSGFDRDLVKEVYYTIGLWDEEQTTSTTSGTYIIGDDVGNKKFEQFADTKDWLFIIDPDGMVNTLGQTYTVALSFKVVDPNDIDGDGDGFAIIGVFNGRTQYVEDKNKNKN